MIIFYDKRTGEIHGTIDGRVHTDKQTDCFIDNGIGEENIGKYIIGWVEKEDKKIEHNLDKFELLQKFEDITPFSPLDCKIIDGQIISPDQQSEQMFQKETSSDRII